MYNDRVREHYDRMTHSHRKVADYIEGHAEDVAFHSLESLSDLISVSTTTIIRFARAIGYSGFTEMQHDIKHELLHKSTLPERLEKIRDTGGNDLLFNSFALDMDNIRQTLDAQKPEDLAKAVHLIENARNIYILGMRSSFSMAQYLASRLGEIKKNVRFIQSTGMIYPEEIVGAESGDICIAYIFPRYSKTAANVLSWMRSRGVKTILFTSLNDAPIRHYADVCFHCAVQSIACKNSLTAVMCLTNYLVAEISRRNFEEAHEVLSRTEEILSSGFYLGI